MTYLSGKRLVEIRQVFFQGSDNALELSFREGRRPTETMLQSVMSSCKIKTVAKERGLISVAKSQRTLLRSLMAHAQMAVPYAGSMNAVQEEDASWATKLNAKVGFEAMLFV